MIQVECSGQPPLILLSEAEGGSDYTFHMRSSFGSELSNRAARDLLRVGQAAFLTDRAFRRGTRLGQQTRDLCVTVEVEEPERWSAIARRVADLARFVSHDRWEFRFSPLRIDLPVVPRPDWQALNPCVSLFSDGLDSLCGAAAALQEGATPVFVSHSPPGWHTVQARVAALTAALEPTGDPPRFFNFTLRAGNRNPAGKRSRFPERSRRTRPLLFLSLAGAVSLELGIPRILMNENGVLAVNLPFQAHISGPLISRHAHPETLRRFTSLLGAVWPWSSPPRVENPFFSLTKAEELTFLASAPQLAAETISCEYGRQQVSTLLRWLRERGRDTTFTKECGLCQPCLVRRSALGYAGISEPEGHYVFDARQIRSGRMADPETPLYPVVAANPGDLYAFCRRFLEFGPSQFTCLYLPELSLLPGPGEDVARISRAVFSLYERFAGQVCEYFEKA